jgi:hypothetical protein
MRFASLERAEPEDLLWVLLVAAAYAAAYAVWWVFAQAKRRRQARSRLRM